MPVWLRRTLIALAVGVALLAAAAAWLAASFDPNRYKGLLIDWMRENRQRTLAIDGPIELGVFPRLQVTLRDVRLSEHASPDEFAALREAALAVQVLPLLHKQLAVDRVEARGVRLAWRRDAQGRSNIDDLLGAPPARKGEAREPGGGAPALRFDVSRVVLEDVQATVQDAKSGVDGRFVVEKLATGRLADGAEAPVEFLGRAQLAKPAVNAAVDLKGRLSLALPAGAPAKLGLQDLKLALRGEAFGVKQLDASLQGGLGYDGASGALEARKLRLALSATQGALALRDTTLALDALAYDPARRALRLEALDLRLAGHHGEQALAGTLAWPKLEVAGDTLKGSPLKGSASLKGGDAPALQLRFESQAPSGSFERIRMPGLRVAVDGGSAGRTVKGEARTDLTLAPSPLAASLDALKLQLAFADPALPTQNLALAGQARAGAKDADWRLDGTLNGQRFDSSGRADLGGARPRVEAQARFDALDLTRFVKPAAGAASGARAAGKASGPAAGGDAPVDLAGLKALDGRFGLRAGTLVYPPYRVADAALEATLANGVLKVGRLSGRAWGGRFDAQGSADANTQRVGLKLDANGVDIAALLGDVAQFRRLEGTGRFSADVTTQGTSVAQFRQRLGGRAALELRDGALRGINLAKTLRQWKSAIRLDREAVQRSSAEEKTDFSEISASFAIADGVARNKDLTAKSPFLRVGGEGLVDIGRGRVDYLARATVTATPEGQGGAELAALKGVTVPVQVVGPFDAVDYHVQWSAVAAALVGNRAREALSESARGAVGGLLKGLGGAQPAPGASAPAGKASASRAPSPKDALKGLFGR